MRSSRPVYRHGRPERLVHPAPVSQSGEGAGVEGTRSTFPHPQSLAPRRVPTRRGLAWSRLLPLVALALLLLAAAPASAVPLYDLQDVRVVLDPGHGGDDWGVDPAGSGLREKEVVLDIAGRLQRRLEERGARVFVTRTTDRFVSLGARVRFANAVLFRPDNVLDHGRLISIHLNSNRQNPNLERVEVIVDPQAEVPAFAVHMANALEQATEGGFGYRDAGYPPGVHPGDIAPVRWTYPRGNNVLTEAAFLSNPSHAARLRDPAFLDRIAKAHLVALETTIAAGQ